MAEHPSVPVRLAAGADSGLASIVQQYLEQDLEEFSDKRRLAGRLRESATFSAGPFGAPVALSGGWLYLGTGASGVYTPFMRIDDQGDGELAGTVRERSTLAIDPEGQALGASASRFWLSTDAVVGACEWRTSEEILHLKGILIESVRL